jgi:hypothetical protein
MARLPTTIMPMSAARRLRDRLSRRCRGRSSDVEPGSSSDAGDLERAIGVRAVLHSRPPRSEASRAAEGRDDDDASASSEPQRDVAAIGPRANRAVHRPDPLAHPPASPDPSFLVEDAATG